MHYNKVSAHAKDGNIKILCFGKCPLNTYHDCNKHHKSAVKAVTTVMTDSLVSDCFVNTIMSLIPGEDLCGLKEIVKVGQCKYLK